MGFSTTSYLIFTNLSFSNAGTYICQASNNLVVLRSSNSSAANLTVNCKCYLVDYDAVGSSCNTHMYVVILFSSS